MFYSPEIDDNINLPLYFIFIRMSNLNQPTNFGGFSGFPKLSLIEQFLMLQRALNSGSANIYNGMLKHLSQNSYQLLNLQNEITSQIDSLRGCSEEDLLRNNSELRLKLNNLVYINNSINQYWEGHLWEM